MNVIDCLPLEKIFALERPKEKIESCAPLACLKIKKKKTTNNIKGSIPDKIFIQALDKEVSLIEILAIEESISSAFKTSAKLTPASLRENFLLSSS